VFDRQAFSVAGPSVWHW